MSQARLRRESRRIALFNVGASLALAFLILAAGAVLLRQVIARMRDVVGEARMARELKQVNAELEAFSYSVSHDLRAPLRTVDGFSHILLEDYAGALDETGRDYLQRVRRGCQRMGQLIDDLLRLSRVVRHEFRFEPVDLAVLARGIVEGLRLAEPQRTVEVVVAESLPARGDPGLLRAALENLIGNAWKFSSKVPAARIEFGAEPRDGRPVYFVRDNGAGFDMAYTGKLFGAFQRMHSQEEFPGTGVGLATVQRIVVRHGGRIWAESAVGRGATFYFTLGKD
jgi:light-regulated signal transduction histidine kinase (bacteriophytochrome)